MCGLFYACSYDQVYDLIKLVMVCAFFVIVPLVLVIRFVSGGNAEGEALGHRP